MKKTLLLFVLTAVLTVNLSAQDRIKVHDQRFYFKLDLESGNIFTCAALAGVSAGFNAITHRDFSINAFTINSVKAKESTEVKNYLWNKIGTEDLFKDMQTGIRIGAKTDKLCQFRFLYFASLQNQPIQVEGFCNEGI